MEMSSQSLSESTVSNEDVDYEINQSLASSVTDLITSDYCHKVNNATDMSFGTQMVNDGVVEAWKRYFNRMADCDQEKFDEFFSLVDDREKFISALETIY